MHDGRSSLAVLIYSIFWARYFRENGVHIVGSNQAFYGGMLARIMTILGEIAAEQEIYSIDESFLDVSGIAAYMPLEESGHQMRDRIIKETGLTIGVGFDPFRTLAKLANFAAKKWRVTNGIVDLWSPARQRKLLALVDIDNLWGTGGRLSKRLHTTEIITSA